MSATSRSACGAVLVVGGSDGLARDTPLFVVPVAQIVKAALRGKMLGAVDRNRLSGQPFTTVCEEERGEILQFTHVAVAPHRIDLLGARARVLTRPQPLARTFGREDTGRDCVEADTVAAPLHGERARHR